MSGSASSRSGLVGTCCAVGAFGMWGFAPVYFKLVGSAGPLEILAHRIVWSVVLLVAVILGSRRLARPPRPETAGGPVGAAWGRKLAIYGVTTLLISGNWLLYIWAVNAGHIVESSLGYYINPLVNVLLGVIFLQERLARMQLMAIGLALVGVAVLVVQLGRLPWLALVLPVQFGLYGLIRKKAGFDPLLGLLVETALLAPAALAYLGWRGACGQLAFLAHGPAFAAQLAFAGVMTALPLLLFLHGAKRLRLSTLGVVQFIAPTCQLAAGVLLYGEPFTPAHGLALAFIWSGLALYTMESFRWAARPAAAS